MAVYYKIPNSQITSISVDGVEHKVNPDTGLLEVNVMTANLEKELLGHHKAQLVDTNKLTPDEEIERQMLFEQLEAHLHRKIDRRRSLGQLRTMKEDLGLPDTSLTSRPPAPGKPGLA